MPTDLPYDQRDPARCFRGACYVLLPADGGWFNTGNGKHYCRTCARLINQYNMAGEKALCVPPTCPDHVDDFGGIHCPACPTVHGETDACPTCGRAVRHSPGTPNDTP